MSTDLKYEIRKHATTIAPLTGAIGLALAGTQLQASTITVETLQDSAPDPFGPCTLRSAIYASLSQMNEGGCPAGSGNDTIVFAEDLSGTLTLDEDVSSGFGEGAALAVMSSVTIAGPGADVITIDGAESGPVFHVRPQDGTSFPSELETVTISGLTITNGLTSGTGGGIRSAAPELVLDEVVITGNQAQAGGGGVWLERTWERVELTMRDSVISQNLTVTGRGGGIGMHLYRDMGEVTIEDSVFAGNTALNDEGGGFSLSAEFDGFSWTDVTLTDNEFISNSGRYAGGGVHLDQNYMRADISGNLFANNSATGEGNGGGLYLSIREALDVGANFTVANNQFQENFAAGHGGGAFITLSGPYCCTQRELTLDYNRFFHNEAYGRGGGLVIEATRTDVLNIYDDQIIGNISGDNGGGMYLRTDTNSTAYLGGLVISDNNDDPSFTGFIDGGGLYARIESGTFVGNNLTLTNNSAGSGNGGGALLSTDANSTLYLISSTISDNFAAGYGGGVFASGNNDFTQIAGSAIRDNTGLTHGGGVAFLAFGNEDAQRIVRNSEISGNVSGEAGGIGMVSHQARLLVTNSTVSGNTGTAFGGGIGLLDDTQDAKLDVRYSTIAFNQSNRTTSPGGRGGGIRFGNADCSILNSIVANNDSSGEGPDLFGDGNCQLEYSLISDTSDAGIVIGDGAIFNQDPQLAPLANNGGTSLTHAIDADSPAYNTGERQSIYVLPFDQRGPGFDRIMFGALDMGAYEFQNRTDELFRDRFQAP